MIEQYEIKAMELETRPAREKARRVANKLIEERNKQLQRIEALEETLIELNEEDVVLTEDIVQSKKELARRGYNVSEGDEYVPIVEGGLDRQEGTGNMLQNY